MDRKELQKFLVKRKDGTYVYLEFSDKDKALDFLNENYQRLGLRKTDLRSFRKMRHTDIKTELRAPLVKKIKASYRKKSYYDEICEDRYTHEDY